MGEELKLAVDCIRLFTLAAPDVMSVTLQMMRFPFVGQLNVKDVFQTTNQLEIADRKENFDAMTQVPAHKISAAEIDFLGSTIAEVVDTAVL